MQILALVGVNFIVENIFELSESTSHDGTRIILFWLNGMHVLSYIAQLFRKWELEKKGKFDNNRLLRAPIEQRL